MMSFLVAEILLGSFSFNCPCFASSSKAVALAKKNGTRLQVLHITTAEELALFNDPAPRGQKRITAEVCVHHLWFDADDYLRLGNQIKCNPAIKEGRHKAALLAALKAGTLDVIATDHAPHTWEEKQQPYLQAPAGLPLVQHPLLMLYTMHTQGKLVLPLIADRAAHAVADDGRRARRPRLDGRAS
jgi:dihydroorotase